jgi:CRISPR-associated protein Cas1
MVPTAIFFSYNQAKRYVKKGQDNMEYLSDLKAILHSKRANIYYLEKCRVMVKDGRVVYLTEAKKSSSYWNIPIANTTVILLGIGTSITQAAVRMLASAGVLIGFSGSGGTPLLAGNEIEWMTPQSEYRPTEYVQGWLAFWYDEQQRLAVAKQFQKARIGYIDRVWKRDKDFQSEGFYFDDPEIEQALSMFSKDIDKAQSVNDLLRTEALMTKQLYKYAAKQTGAVGFVRTRGEETDQANAFLDQGNYLAYGLAATTLWVLGIPHGFAVMHGKTRRGALVFDVADLVKDALVLPLSFICARTQARDQEFRELCLQAFVKHSALDYMFDTVKDISLSSSRTDGIS